MGVYKEEMTKEQIDALVGAFEESLAGEITTFVPEDSEWIVRKALVFAVNSTAAAFDQAYNAGKLSGHNRGYEEGRMAADLVNETMNEAAKLAAEDIMTKFPRTKQVLISVIETSEFDFIDYVKTMIAAGFGRGTKYVHGILSNPAGTAIKEIQEKSKGQ